MLQELKGLVSLTVDDIKNMKCDMEKPFAFLSYSHDDYDAQIVMNVFQKLTQLGYNLWIDVVNMPYNEESWSDAAVRALSEKKCQIACFFRSESSMQKDAIVEELDTIKSLDHIESIVIIDIWHDTTNTAEKFRHTLLNSGNVDLYKICRQICKCVSVDCNALRVASDMNNDINQLVAKMADILEPVRICNDVQKDVERMPTLEKETLYTSKITLSDFLQQYDNTRFKKDTYAKFRLVGQGQYQRFTTNYYDSAYDLVWNFVMFLIQEKGMSFIHTVNKNHPGLKNPIFISEAEYDQRKEQGRYRKIESGNKDIDTFYMYRHYGQYQWIDSVLKQRLVEFGLPVDAFVFEYVNEAMDQKAYTKSDLAEVTNGQNMNNTKKSSDLSNSFQYALWGEIHTADKLSNMMHDVFDLIAKKYPYKMPEIAHNDRITAVAFKSDVEERKLSIQKLNYFERKVEHKVGEELYYVSTRYNREQGIGQLQRMLQVCEGTDVSLQILSTPPKN